MIDQDEKSMAEALRAAHDAGAINEVPIGACIVDENGSVVASAGNRTIIDNDPTAHAEILVLREAAKKLNNYRLTGCTLYTTIEPCAMCAGALVNARVTRLVYGARDEKYGAVDTLFQIVDHSLLNHQIIVESGVLAKECREVVREFFQRRRAERKA